MKILVEYPGGELTFLYELPADWDEQSEQQQTRAIQSWTEESVEQVVNTKSSIVTKGGTEAR
jgi:hypothetical protein